MDDNPTAKKLDAITKTLFTIIRSLGIVFITIMIDAIISPSYYSGFIALTLGVLSFVPILGMVFYGLIDSCLCNLQYEDRIKGLYNFFVETFQTIIQFGIVGIGLFLINAYKSNISPKISLAFIITYIVITLLSAVITLLQINKYYKMLKKH
jgi:hypothetical protein